MAKKNHTLGKFLAFTTTVAAIGGTCYIFRDQIKQSTIYQKSAECFSKLFGKVSDTFCKEEDDDFFFDDDDEDEKDTSFNNIFSEDAKKNREYTSITINPKDNENAADTVSVTEESTPHEEFSDNKTEAIESPLDSSMEQKEEVFANDDLKETKEDMKEIFSDDSIPTITFGNNYSTSDSHSTESTSNITEEAKTVTAYENEGLSDVSEDPDVLEEEDKLDY